MKITQSKIETEKRAAEIIQRMIRNDKNSKSGMIYERKIYIGEYSNRDS